MHELVQVKASRGNHEESVLCVSISNVLITYPAASVCVCSRVDHLYSFFVQWSPDVYGKEAREQGFVVVDKEELDMIDNFFSDPASCSWEVSSVVGSSSTGSYASSSSVKMR